MVSRSQEQILERERATVEREKLRIAAYSDSSVGDQQRRPSVERRQF